MDRSVNPCEDFYAFSCGNYVKKFGKADNDSIMNGMATTLKLALKNLLENVKEPPDSMAGKVKMVYDTCTDYRASEVNAVPSVLEYLNYFGIKDWPNLKADFEFSHSSLEQTIAKLHAYSEFSFLNLNSATDELDESYPHDGLLKFSIFHSHPLLSGSDDAELLGVYEDIVIKILNHLGVDFESANRTWEEFKYIDSLVLKLWMDNEAEKSDQSEKLNVDYGDIPPYHLDCSSNDNAKISPICEVLKYFVEYTGTGHKFSSNYVNIISIYYIESLFPMIGNLSSKSVANYLALRFVINHLEELDSYFRLMNLECKKLPDRKLNVRTINKWEDCLLRMATFMVIPLGELYVPTVFVPDYMEEMNSIVQTFLEVAADYTDKQIWIAEREREILKYSVKNMTNTIEKIIITLSDASSKWKSFMQEFQPTNRSFFHNFMEYRKWFSRLILLEGYYLESMQISQTLFHVNAFHFPGSFNLMLGMLLPPVFSYGLPNVVNFATLGPTIGHEVGHEVVDFFADKENLHNSTEAEYQKKRKCLEDQYFDFDIHKIGKKVKGNETFDENLSDLIGMELTQQVIKKFFQLHNESTTFALPALGLSTKQLLYVAAAQMWCTVRSEEKELHYYENDVHAPPSARIIGRYQNMKEFAEAFSCPLGSYMNPIRKCSFYEDPSESKD